MDPLYINEHIAGLISFASLSLFFLVKAALLNKLKREKRVAVVGLTCLDIHACPVDKLPANGGVSFVDDIHMSLAGTAGGMAVTIAKLIGGNKVDYYGSVGDDYIGKLIIDLLTAFGINPCYLQKQKDIPTSATVINVRTNGDRPCLHRLGASDYLQLSSRDIQRICHSADIIHIGGTSLLPGMPSAKTLRPLLEAVSTYNNRITVVMDLIAPHAETLQTLEYLLPHADYFMPSLEEAEVISGCSGPLACGKYFMGKLGVKKACIFKAGEVGSFVISYTNSNNNSFSSGGSSTSTGNKRKGTKLKNDVFLGFPTDSDCGDDELNCDLSILMDDSATIVGSSGHSPIKQHTLLSNSNTTTPTQQDTNNSPSTAATSSDFKCCRISAFPLDVIPENIITLYEAKMTQSSPSSLSSLSGSLLQRSNGVVDTTGCGDNYCAGFIAGLFLDMSIYESCRLGTATAALCATGVGSDAGNIDLDFAQSFIKEHDAIRLKQLQQKQLDEDAKAAVLDGSVNNRTHINQGNHDDEYHELIERKAEFENAVKERDFYLEKLMEIEFMLLAEQQQAQQEVHVNSGQESNDDNKTNILAEIFKVLYATKEGFGIDNNSSIIDVEEEEEDNNITQSIRE